MIPNKHTILFKATRAVIDDLEIEGCEEGERDKTRNLLQEGGVLFRTAQGKLWFCKFSEFSFCVNWNLPPIAERKAA